MASPNPTATPVGPDTLITVKVIFDGCNRRFKLALRDLGANMLPQKLRLLLAIPPDVEVKFDRFSDSAGDYVTLDSTNPAVYKQLYRAAKAKMKLRLMATIIKNTPAEATTSKTMNEPTLPIDDTNQQAAATQTPAEPRQSYLETVLSYPPQNPVPSFRSFQTSRPIIPSSNLIAAIQASAKSIEVPQNKPATSDAFSKATVPSLHKFYGSAFSIDCNECHESIPNEHFHCSICENGDFDLCQSCVDQGVTCDGDDHWLIKRFIQGGVVVPSRTEKMPPRSTEAKKSTYIDSITETISSPANATKDADTRTCNSCIESYPEDILVTCKDCPDFDLCHSCFKSGEHGHHPAHIFRPVDECQFTSLSIMDLCQAGRGLLHEAICDGCDKHIVGVRHKCLNCPDWDYCSTCVLSTAQIHPGHRFAPLYEPLAGLIPRGVCHYGIHCDGPLCAGRTPKSYIRGIRYKCAVCHDTDFCANCEALPTHQHNKTHPLIKFTTPVRNVSITTIGEDDSGRKISQLGDRIPHARNASTETMPPAQSANAATQVHTVAEVKPAEIPIPVTPKVEEKFRPAPLDLQAWFESDSTPDGTRFGPNRLVAQSWTLRNPGPQAWPVGCAVYFIGGDDMRNLDTNHPSSISAMTTANRSNVLEHSLEPGKIAEFKVILKSPPREGRVISYWRLKTPEGVSFGHKLWVDITVAASTVESPKALSTPSTSTIEQPEPTPRVEEIKSEESSIMIFPKLDKESPASSMHEITEVSAVPNDPTIKSEEQELLEDIESLELDDESEDGFMTDEEYDILDASDEDFLIEAQKAVHKQ